MQKQAECKTRAACESMYPKQNFNLRRMYAGEGYDEKGLLG